MQTTGKKLQLCLFVCNKGATQQQFNNHKPCAVNMKDFTEETNEILCTTTAKHSATILVDTR